MANGGLRINQKLTERHSPGYIARKAAKRADRATFRQQAQQGFAELSNGLRVIDYAVVGVYEAFVGFRSLQIAVDIAVVTGLLLVTAFVARYIVLTAGGIAYAALAMHIYSVRRRAAKAKEQAYIAALKNAQGPVEGSPNGGKTHTGATPALTAITTEAGDEPVKEEA